MTTLNPFTYSPDSHFGSMANIQDPHIWVWENVTYADNYYQDLKSSPLTVRGLNLEGETNSHQQWRADVNLNLNEKANVNNFTAPNSKSPYREVVRWYTGTANVSHRSEDDLGEYEYLYRRLGDYEINNVFTSNNPNPVEVWYTPDDPDSDFENGDEDAVWEGIGNGWFYSVLGGGKDLRPYDVLLQDGTLERKEKSELGDFAKYLEDNRVTVMEDNTRLPESRGDFAVPTLFNGNFEAISFPSTSQTIPGWSLYNNTPDAFQSALVEWNSIDTLSDQYKSGVGYVSTEPNYALELGSGDSITHNRFVVADWGVLRLDLHTPNLSGGGAVTVSLQSDEPGYTNYILNTITLTSASGGASTSDPAGQYLSDRYKIGYGTEGFETFHFDLPPALRGKVATLEIEVQGNTVYLDNVFFQSKHLWFGNPTLNGQQAGTALIQNVDNYLIEKPQYSLSYNSNTKNPNWVSYQLDKTWLGSASRSGKKWTIDPELPLVQNDPSNDNPFRISEALYDNGHLTTSSHRTRSNKDIRATFLRTNDIPQHSDNNRFFSGEAPQNSAWLEFENYLKSLVEDGSKELYIIAGVHGSNPDPVRFSRYIDPNDPTQLTDPTLLTGEGVTIPGWTWRIALVLDETGQSPNDVEANAKTYAILTPNTTEPENNAPYDNPSDFVSPVTHPFNTLGGFTGSVPINIINNKAEWRNWQNWRVTIDDIEALTGLDFLTNIPENIQNVIEQTLSPVINPNAFLLAEPDALDKSIGFIFDSSIGHDGVVKDGLSTSKSTFSTSQISTTQIGTNKTASSEISINQAGIDQISIFKINSFQIGSIHNSTSQISTIHHSSRQISTSQISSPQIGLSKIDSLIVDNALATSHTKIKSTQVSPTQIDSSKITLPSSISSQQLLSSHLPNHNSTSNFVSNFQSSVTSIWSDLLKSETSLEINFQITDLPTGQLAEAQITSFNEFGLPQTGTILIDYNANGVGWFIDRTPFENSEFGLENAEWAFQATPESEAYGKYDLLTAILHETAHLYGFIDNY
jgi:DNA/RNA endonuclease G (NUC1)